MDEGPVLKNLSKIALAALGILLLGAVVYFKERMLFADAAYILFTILNYHSVAIQEYRYGSFVTQIVPYLGQKLHLPIKALLAGYAVSFNLFYCAVAALLVYRYKQYGLAILMGLYYFLLVSSTYFWISNEIHQAVAWMFLFFGVTIYLGYKGLNVFLFLLPFLLLAFLTVFTHFIVIIPLVFLWFYFWMERKHWPFSQSRSLLLSGLLLVVIALKYTFAVSHLSYDSAHLHGVTHFSINDIIQSFAKPVIIQFLQRCLTNYWIAVIVFILGIAGLFRNNEKRLLVWAIVSCLGYFIIMGLTYGDCDANVQLFHIESEWECLGIIIATPFVFTLLPTLKFRFAAWFLVILFGVRLFYICTAIPLFTWRTHFQERVLAQMKKKNITKLVLYDDAPAIRGKYMLNWGAPYESILMSAMNGDKPQLTFSFVNRDDKQTISSLVPDKFNSSFGMVPAGSLDREYFIIDTVHPYQVMTYDDFMK